MATETHEMTTEGTKEMTEEEAREFRHFSVHNAVQAQMACPEQSCKAYEDIFTFRRWRAQGYAVRKGEKGTAVTTWVTTKGRRDEEPKTRPKRAVLFCRHQVERAA
ncbi:MAG: ArdC family protein [Actinomycetota bacterium]